MNEDELFALVGRLYVNLLTRDNEVKRLQDLLERYEARAREASAPEEPRES